MSKSEKNQTTPATGSDHPAETPDLGAFLEKLGTTDPNETGGLRKWRDAIREGDDKATDPAPAVGSTDQAMDLTTLRSHDVTYVIFRADPRPYMPSFGTRSEDFFGGLVRQVANSIAPFGRYADNEKIKFILAFIRESKPRDEREAVLLCQIATTNDVVMRYANRLACAESLQEQEIYERIYNRTARTFVALMEQLQRYRATSEARVIVQNVSINDGAQAIVGHVAGTPREAAMKKQAPVREVTGTRRSPMQTIREPQRAPVARRRQKR